MTGGGYKALRESAALIDLTGRGWLRAAGADRVRLLHNMSTNHVKELSPGQGKYAFFLTVQGRILGDANILCRKDALYLDTEPETAAKLLAHLNKYVIADDVEFTDLTAATGVLGVEGPEAERVLAALGAPTPRQECDCADWDGKLVARLSFTGQPGFRIFLPVEEKAALAARLGLPEATSGDARTVRVENGRPRYGDDIGESNLPQETRQMQAIHFNKGCYLGQEIVERVRARGHVNWLLVALRIESTEVPERGAKLFSADKEVGEITSAVLSPESGRVAALGYVRAEMVNSRAELSVGGAPAGYA